MARNGTIKWISCGAENLKVRNLHHALAVFTLVGGSRPPHSTALAIRCCLLSTLVLATLAAQPSDRKPNILIIVAGFLGGAHDYLDAATDQHNPILRGTNRVDNIDYTTDAFGREAVQFIEEHHDKPGLC